MSRALLCLLALGAALAASETAGPFPVSAKHHDPGAPASWAIARDGTMAAATLATGDAAAGTIDVALWAGDNQAAGRGAGGINLFGPAGETAWLGLNADWRIGEGTDGAGDVPTKLVWPIQHQYRAGDSTNDIDMNVETKQVFVIGLGRRADGQPGYETIMAVFKVGASTASMSRGIQSGQYRE